jgi:hypothetical protein
MTADLAAVDWDALEDELDAVSYARIPTILRRWLWPGYLPIGNPALFAGDGDVGKGMLFSLVLAHVVLGIPFPGDDSGEVPEPGRVVWIAGMEDDQFEDLAPRFRAAIAYLVGLHDLDPALADEVTGAIRYAHDLAEWRDGSPFQLPADCDRLQGLVGELGKLDAENRRPERKDGSPNPDYTGPWQPVRLVVMDPLSELLADGYTIDSRQGARRVLRPVKRFARAADVAVVIIHHLTKDGKVAGSPAVLDCLRLAFVITRRKDNPQVRAITRRKSNISDAEPQQYTTVHGYPDTVAVWVDAADQRTERVKQAAARGDDPASLRARMRAAVRPDSEHERWSVVRCRMLADGKLTAPETLGRPLASREMARAAAEADAHVSPLDWRQAGTRETAGVRDRYGPGLHVTYAVQPASAS